MVNKKGFIRTLEAVIAIIVILSIIFYITPRVVEFEEKVPEDVANAKEFIMNQVLFNKEYSKCIVDVTNYGNCESALGNCESATKIMGLFEYVPYGYSWHCEICSDTNPICTTLPQDVLEKSIYTNSIFVYKAGQDYNIMRIYIWKK